MLKAPDARCRQADGQPLSALLTAATNCAMSTECCALAKAGQASRVSWPSAMLTPVIRSEMLTAPLPPQSPTHGLEMRVGVAVGCTGPDGVAVGDGRAIPDSVQSGSQPSSGS